MVQDWCKDINHYCIYGVHHYGEEKAKQYIPVQTYRHYKDRADEIREVMMNGKRDVKSYELAMVEINERIEHIIDETGKLKDA